MKIRPESGSYALVVAIDRYDDPTITQLATPVLDAVVFVDWLDAIGVPKSNIYVHAPTSSPHFKRLQGLVPAVRRADKATVDDSLHELHRVNGSETSRLFVVFSGHGFWLRDAPGRVLITQEADSTNDNWPTLGIESYVEVFRSLRIPNTYLFFDACANTPCTEDQRELIAADGPSGFPKPSGQRGHSVFACYAASQEEFTLDAGSSAQGVFMKTIINALDPRRPADYVSIDPSTGARSVDFRQIFNDIVSPTVSVEAARAHGEQSPALEVYGDALKQSDIPILTLEGAILDLAGYDRLLALTKAQRSLLAGRGWFEVVRDSQSRVMTARDLHYRVDALCDAAVRWPSCSVCTIEAFTAVQHLVDDLLRSTQRIREDAKTWLMPDDVRRDAYGGLEDLRKHLQEIADMKPDAPYAERHLVERTECAESAAVLFRCAIEATFSEAVLRAAHDGDLEVDDDLVRNETTLLAALLDSARLHAKAEALLPSLEALPSDVPRGYVRAHWRMEGARPWLQDTNAIGASGELNDLSRKMLAVLDPTLPDGPISLSCQALRRLDDLACAFVAGLGRTLGGTLRPAYPEVSGQQAIA
jgi:hypothetical protein